MLIGYFIIILLSRRLPRPFGPRNDSGGHGYQQRSDRAINFNSSWHSCHFFHGFGEGSAGCVACRLRTAE